jgi:hypothetical protein
VLWRCQFLITSETSAIMTEFSMGFLSFSRQMLGYEINYGAAAFFKALPSSPFINIFPLMARPFSVIKYKILESIFFLAVVLCRLMATLIYSHLSFRHSFLSFFLKYVQNSPLLFLFYLLPLRLSLHIASRLFYFILFSSFSLHL